MLEVQHIDVFYSLAQILAGISITVQSGEIVSLVGRNGAGKTTLLRTICRLVEPQKGRIMFQEKDLSKIAAYEVAKAGIAHVPEGRQLFHSLSVEDNLLLGAYSLDRQAKKQIIESSFNFVYNMFPRIKERKNQRSSTLSGGEQQMVAIGRAMMSRPRLLLLDEPSAGLAPLLVKEICFTIDKLCQEEKVSILLVDQNVKIALRICNRAYVLESGKIRAEGKPETLIRNKTIENILFGSS